MTTIPPSLPEDAASDSALAAETRFYRAFAQCDSVAMGSIWARGDEVSCIHPGGSLLRGHDAVAASWRDIFTGARRPEVAYQLLQVTHSDGLAVHLVEERIRPADAPPQHAPTRILATNVYRATAEGWRIIAHHASLPMVESRRPPAPPEARRVH